MPLLLRRRLTGWLSRQFPVASARYAAWRRHRVFRHIFRSNLWGDQDSVSGTGSNLAQTDFLRAELPSLLARYEINTVLDAPCGDLFWMQHVELGVERYIGADIVPDLIEQNRVRFGNAQRSFELCDLVDGELPRADLIFSRDFLVHLSFDEARRALANFRRSGATWLLTTTFTNDRENPDIVTGEWRPLSLHCAPFRFPPPIELLNEKCTEGRGAFADKSLGLWRLAELPEW